MDAGIADGAKDAEKGWEVGAGGVATEDAGSGVFDPGLFAMDDLRGAELGASGSAEC